MERLVNVYASLKQEQESRVENRLSSGFDSLDKEIDGLYAGQLVVIAGREGVGSEPFAMNVVRNLALQTETRIALFPIDLSANAVAERLFRVGQGKNPSDLTKVDERLITAPIYIQDEPINTIEDIMEKVIELKRKNDIQLIVIDCLFSIPDYKKDPKRIVRLLQLLARSLNISVIALSSLTISENDYGNSACFPRLEHLCDSALIEPYIDVVLLLYRWDNHDLEYNEDGEVTDNLALVVVAKNRNKVSKEVKLQHFKEFNLFVDKKTIKN